jgi:hypothetical protein
MRLDRLAIALAAVAPCAIAAFACVPTYGTSADAGPKDASFDVAFDHASETSSSNMPDGGDAMTRVADASDSSAEADAPSHLLDNLVLLLHMDEASWAGTGAVIDSSGRGNDGTATDAGAMPTPTGKLAGAGLFDGNGWVTIDGGAPSLQPSTQMTYAAWVYPTGPVGQGMGVIAKRQGYASDVDYTLFLWQEAQPNVRAYVDIGSSMRFFSTTPIANNQWYHLAVVYDGTQVAPITTLYVNGTADGPPQPAQSTLTSNLEPLLIGSLQNGGGTFIGMIDEVAIWTRALTPAEISAVYTGGAL